MLRSLQNSKLLWLKLCDIHASQLLSRHVNADQQKRTAKGYVTMSQFTTIVCDTAATSEQRMCRMISGKTWLSFPWPVLMKASV